MLIVQLLFAQLDFSLGICFPHVDVLKLHHILLVFLLSFLHPLSLGLTLAAIAPTSQKSLLFGLLLAITELGTFFFCSSRLTEVLS